LREPLDDEERELMDPENWDWDNPVDVRVIGTPGAVLRVRFTRDEYLALARIARDSGVGPVALIHQTMLEQIAAHQEQDGAKNHKTSA
jgi:hypothetical protein